MTQIKRSPGRPVSTGVGIKVGVYLNRRTAQTIDRVMKEWGLLSRSELIQEAVIHYCADLDQRAAEFAAADRQEVIDHGK